MKWKAYESKWQKIWEEKGVFSPKKGGKKFFITVPYPYTSGALHIGHGRTFTTGDIIARFKRHRGYNVLFPMAFHVSGTPILSISDRIASGDVRTIALYRKYVEIFEKDPEKVERILESFRDPEKVADYFADKVIQDFRSIGYSIDWTRRFKTSDPHYTKFVQWQYMKLKEAGVIVKGKHPILWSLEEGQPVGEDDIADGDTDKVAINEFVMVKFRLPDAYLVAASLRPETLYGLTNLWVHPEGIYVRVKVDGENWIISREAADKLEVQGHRVERGKTLRGRELLGRMAESPLDGRKVPVLPAQFVDLDNGTGVVYSVPAHAPYDYQALADLKRDPKLGKLVDLDDLPVIINVPGFRVPAKEMVESKEVLDQRDPVLEELTKEVYKMEFYSGTLNERCGKFAGMTVAEAKEAVKASLLKKGMASIFYETSRKAVTRAKKKVVVALIDDQWFIDYGSREWKERTRKWLKKMQIIPEKYRKSFLDTVDWLDKRPCARRRGLGTKFPFDDGWVIEPLSDSTIYMAFYTIVPHLRDIEPEKLKPELFDYVFLGRGSAEGVEKLTGIDRARVEAMREEFEYWYPNELRHTAPAHISNHLTFFIMHHLMIFPEKDWPRGISLNEMLIREGVKMSKSKGNVIPLADVAGKYGSDLYRLYVASSADIDSVVDWRERDVQAVSNKLERFIEIVERAVAAEEGELGTPDRWFLSKFHANLREATERMEKFQFRDAVVALLFKNLNNFKWLERRSRNPYGTVRRVVNDWLIAMAPFVPHTAEEYWQGEGFASLAPWPEPEEMEGVEEEEFVISVLEQVRGMEKMTGKDAKKVYIYTAPEWKYGVLKAVLERKQEAIKEAEKFEDREAAAKMLKSWIKRRVWERIKAPIDEERVLKEAAGALREELGKEVVINSEHDPMGKREKAVPLGPAIYLE